MAIVLIRTMTVDEKTAKFTGENTVKRYCFCSSVCKKKFYTDPATQA